MKWSFILIFIVWFQTSAFAVEKVSREELFTAFNGKSVLINGKINQSCFSVEGNLIKPILIEGKCDQILGVTISHRGELCIETLKRERCARVRKQDNGDFAWGGSLRRISIFNEDETPSSDSNSIVSGDDSRLARAHFREGHKLYKREKFWQAVELFKKSAELGFSEAQYKYAYALEKGRGADKDTENAKKWYKKAADQGHDKANARLGNLYLKSEDYTEALEYFKKAANAGILSAQTSIGKIYEKGSATGWGNPQEAFKWYMMAAKSGDKRAQYKVCRVLFKKGAHRYDEAKIWCNRAAGQGSTRANNLLEKMSNW